MISLIDVFQARDTGLPDISRISPAQIFNGSAAASLEAMKQKYDPDHEPSYTVKREPEVRRARVVEEVLNGKFVQDRGHSRGNLGSRSGGYVPGDTVEPPLPSSEDQSKSILNNDLNIPGPTFKSHSLFPPGMEPPVEDSVAEFSPLDYLKKLPGTVLSELRNLKLIP